MLRIHEVIIELVRFTAPLAAEIARHDSALAKQYREALRSVALNTAEGSDQRGARRASHYSIALGSARESWSALRTAAAWGYIAEPSDEMRNRFDHVIGTLYEVAHRKYRK
jgi:four helix bundle protein